MSKVFQLTIESFSESDPEIRKAFEKDRKSSVQRDGTAYYLIGEKVYSCPDTPETRALMEKTVYGSRAGNGLSAEEETWKAVLNRLADAAALTRFGIRDQTPRCVILFRPLQHTESRLLLENIPTEEPDRIVPLENGDIVLIKSMKNRAREEADEYAAAVTETMESEAGITCCAGIGGNAETLAQVSASYEDARAAMETGIRHKLPGRVYSYDRQALERLADLIPGKSAAEFRKGILTPQAEKIMTDEILETIRVFFQNDLNLSTTARQLFIHRNTLIYRMEKIRKATGLDLRRFEDAAVFRLMMCFSENGD